MNYLIVTGNIMLLMPAYVNRLQVSQQNRSPIILIIIIAKGIGIYRPLIICSAYLASNHHNQHDFNLALNARKLSQLCHQYKMLV